MCQCEFSFTERKLTDTIHHCQRPCQARDVFCFLLSLNGSPRFLGIWFLKCRIYNQIEYDPQCRRKKNHVHMDINFAGI